MPDAWDENSSFGVHPLHYLELNEMRVGDDGYYVTVGKVAISAVGKAVAALVGAAEKKI